MSKTLSPITPRAQTTYVTAVNKSKNNKSNPQTTTSSGNNKATNTTQNADANKQNGDHSAPLVNAAVRPREKEAAEIDIPVWLIVTVIVTTVLATIYFSVSVVNYAKKFQANDPQYPKWTDFYYGSVYGTGFCIARFVLCTFLFRPLGDWVIARRKNRWHDTYREKKVDKFSISMFKFLYFAFMVGYGYYTLKDEIWFPRELGGEGHIHNIYQFYPYAIAPTKIKTFFLFAMGYHLQCMVYHCFVLEHRKDFLELLFHHMLTIILIVFSWMVTYFHIGCLVLFVHDVPDFFVYLTRLFVDTKWKKSSFMCWIGLTSSWFYCRLYVLGYLFLWKEVWLIPVEPVTGGELYGRTVLGPMLLSLVCLHVYWFIKIFLMGLSYLKLGVTIDTQLKMNKTTHQKVLEKEIDTENEVAEMFRNGVSNDGNVAGNGFVRRAENGMNGDGPTKRANRRNKSD